LKKPNEYYDFPHHLNMDDLYEIAKMFPGSIPEREATVSTNLTIWGELAREALSLLIIEGKLYLDHAEPNGRIIRRKLKWASETSYKPDSKIMQSYLEFDFFNS
jgi:hypothetical protein